MERDTKNALEILKKPSISLENDRNFLKKIVCLKNILLPLHTGRGYFGMVISKKTKKLPATFDTKNIIDLNTANAYILVE